MSNYRVTWPVTNPNVTVANLVATATREYWQMAFKAQVHPTREPRVIVTAEQVTAIAPAISFDDLAWHVRQRLIDTHNRNHRPAEQDAA